MTWGINLQCGNMFLLTLRAWVRRICAALDPSDGLKGGWYHTVTKANSAWLNSPNGAAIIYTAVIKRRSRLSEISCWDQAVTKPPRTLTPASVDAYECVFKGRGSVWVGMSYVLTRCPLHPPLSSGAIKHFITTLPGETGRHSGVECGGEKRGVMGVGREVDL